MSPSSSASACCIAAVLNQQQEALHHYNQSEKACTNLNAKPAKTCTVVENGRVVVKPVQPTDEQEPIS